MLRAQTGDREALGELFTILAAPLAGYIGTIVRNDALAEDVLQDVFVIVHRRIYWLDAPEAFRSWIYRIAAREAIRAARREMRGERITDQNLDWNTIADPLAVNADAMMHAKEAAAAIADLTPASRAVMTLHYVEGLTLAEAADVLGVAPGTAKSRLASGLVQLRAMFTGGRRPK